MMDEQRCNVTVRASCIAHARLVMCMRLCFSVHLRLSLKTNKGFVWCRVHVAGRNPLLFC